MLVNLDKWSALPKHYQAALRAAACEAAKHDADNPPALKRLLAGGTQLRPFSLEIMEACYKTASEVYAETAATNPRFKKIYDSYVAFRSDSYIETSAFFVLEWRRAAAWIERPDATREDIMESSQKFVSTGLAVSMVLLSFVPLALAGPKEDVEAVTLAWGRALGEDDPDKVLPHYAQDAVLWGTLSPTVRADRAALREYFVTAFKVLPRLKVSFGDQLIRVYGDMAVNTGYYTFSYGNDGETKTLPARSAMPPPPK